MRAQGESKFTSVSKHDTVKERHHNELEVNPVPTKLDSRRALRIPRSNTSCFASMFLASSGFRELSRFGVVEDLALG